MRGPEVLKFPTGAKQASTKMAPGIARILNIPGGHMQQIPISALLLSTCPCDPERQLDYAIQPAAIRDIDRDVDHILSCAILREPYRATSCDSDHNFSPIKSIGCQSVSDLPGPWVRLECWICERCGFGRCLTEARSSV